MFGRWKEWVRKNFSKVKFSDNILWSNYLAVLGVVSSIVTLISFFVTADDMKIDIIIAVALFLAALAGIFIYMWWNANHQKFVRLIINNTQINVREGDIFELLDRKPENRKDEISVIAVNDYFDIIVDDRIIAKKTLHGQYMIRMKDVGKLKKLNKAIKKDEFLNKPNNCVKVPDRKYGRKTRYSIGSVVEFESYVLAAATKFDEDNKACLTAEEFVNFWIRFWENIDRIYAGRTINIPLIGTGITRFQNGKPTEQELLEVMLWSLKISGFHNTYSNNQINILIYKSDVRKIDFYHLQHNQIFGQGA